MLESTFVPLVTSDSDSEDTPNTEDKYSFFDAIAGTTATVQFVAPSEESPTVPNSDGTAPKVQQTASLDAEESKKDDQTNKAKDGNEQNKDVEQKKDLEAPTENLITETNAHHDLGEVKDTQNSLGCETSQFTPDHEHSTLPSETNDSVVSPITTTDASPELPQSQWASWSWSTYITDTFRGKQTLKK